MLAPSHPGSRRSASPPGPRRTAGYVLHRHVLVPAFETLLKRRRTLSLLAELETSQWLGREELDSRQLTSLQTLLRYAFDRCPYYRGQWKRLGLDPRAVQTLSDLEHWPLVGREEVRAHHDGMRAETPGLWMQRKRTGGSTGEPVDFYLDETTLERRAAAWHRGYAWAGASLAARQFYFWGAVPGLPWRRRLKDGLYHWLYRRRLVNCFEFRDDRVQDYFTLYERVRPDAVVAFTNPLFELARALERRRLSPTPPHAIVVGAEKLYDYQRRVIESVFRAPVLESYGSREFMLIGMECEERNGLHLTHEHLVVEVVDDGGRRVGPGCEGRLAITDLYNFGMPFVRYLIGDRAVATDRACPCGRALPLLDRVVGRQLDVITTPDGRRVPGEFFAHLFSAVVQAPVHRFQIVQRTAAEVLVRVTPRGVVDAAGRSDIERLVRDAIGPRMTLTFEEVDEIPTSRSGKYQVVVNDWLRQQSEARA